MKNNIREELSFEAKDKSGSVRKGCLIPLCSCEELNKCYDTYVQRCADADHMKLYDAVELKTDVPVFLCLLSPSSCSAENFISRKKVDEIYEKFAEMDCFKEYFKKNNIREELSFEAKDKLGSVRKGCLIPLYDCEELKQCYLDTYAQGYADADHMKLYYTGKLKTEAQTIAFFSDRVKRMWSDPPMSLYFGVALESEGDLGSVIVGNLAVGSLVNNDGENCEIAYVLVKDICRKGVGTASVKCLMNFVSNLIKSKLYSNLKYIQATARTDNIASNKLLNTVGFKLLADPKGDRNCYKYDL